MTPAQRAKIALVFVPCILGACVMLVLDVSIDTLRVLRQWLYDLLTPMVEWAGKR